MSRETASAQFIARPYLKHEELDIFGHKSDEEWIPQLPIHTDLKCHEKHSSIEKPRREEGKVEATPEIKNMILFSVH